MELDLHDQDFEEEDLALTERMIEVVQLHNQKAHAKGLPIAKYDQERKQPYLLYPDGTRSYSL